MRRALAVVLAAASVLLACGGESSDDLGNPVPPPPSGAYVGAYVDPPIYSEQERILAFEDYEKQIGASLDIFHTFHTWSDPFPDAAEKYAAEHDRIPLLSWAGVPTAEITSGRHDELIRERANALKEWGVPVLLRWRWEMNRPNLGAEIGSPADYVAAWRHIHAIFRSESVTTVSWVWCPLADPVADDDFGAYYPGDDVVDWICADGYAREGDLAWEQVFGGFLEWAEEIPKPIVIGEFGRDVSSGTPASLAAWLEQARQAVKAHPQIKGVVFFNNIRGASGDYDLLRVDEARDEISRWVADPYFRVDHR